jgi:integrase
LRRALQQLRRHTGAEGAVIRWERGGSRGMRSGSVVNWFRGLYRELGFNGCSPHSGRRAARQSGCEGLFIQIAALQRRTFITNAARLVFKAGGSLRDVQQLAGHQSIEQTQANIDGTARSKRRLIELM